MVYCCRMEVEVKGIGRGRRCVGFKCRCGIHFYCEHRTTEDLFGLLIAIFNLIKRDSKFCISIRMLKI